MRKRSIASALGLASLLGATLAIGSEDSIRVKRSKNWRPSTKASTLSGPEIQKRKVRQKMAKKSRTINRWKAKGLF